jgi:hypothetical protein
MVMMMDADARSAYCQKRSGTSTTQQHTEGATS